MSVTPLLCVIDTGTSSMRVVLYDHKGEKRYSFQRAYELTYLARGGVEQNARVLSDSMFSLLAQAQAVCRENRWEIEALSLTSQRASVLPLDARGQPLRSILMWQDKRASEICREFEENAAIYDIGGMRPNVACSAPKILWIKRNEPDVYEKAFKLTGIHEYLLHCLTDRFVTDYSIASRSNLFDLRKLAWSGMLAELFGLDTGKLCGLVPPQSIVAHTTAYANRRCGFLRELPVITAGGDQQCALAGIGVADVGTALINLGTGGYVLTLIDDVEKDPLQQINCNVAASGGRYLLESAISRVGLVYQWACAFLFPGIDAKEAYHRVAALADECAAGADGLWFFPAFAGGETFASALYPKRMDMRPFCVARAVIEGLAADVCDCVREMERVHGEPLRYVCSGGLSACQPFVQTLSEMLSCSLAVCEDAEATARGAFLGALTALGLQQERRACIAQTANAKRRIVSPKEENTALYGQLLQERKKLYNEIASLSNQQI